MYFFEGRFMIPLRLTLKNFLSYGPTEQSINFEPYSLMCLSGKNGHGKSAILDSITWAIWGCARKMLGIAKGDDGLVHLGQKEMVVHLEFIAGGQTYRIRREFFKSYGKPVTRLDIELFDSAVGQYITLTDKSIRATQEKIESIVGVDFATFVSTSFLRQGQSNEFSKKTPRERKEIIASIIGLAAFDVKSASALERSKEIGQKILQIQFSCDQATRVSGELSPVETELQGVLVQVQELDDQLMMLSKDFEILSLKAQKKEAVEAEIIRLDEELYSLAALEKKGLEQFEQAVFLWRSLHARIIALPSVDTLLFERSSLVLRLEHLSSVEKMLQQSAAFHDIISKEITVLQVELKHSFELKKADLLRKRHDFVMEKQRLEEFFEQSVYRQKSVSEHFQKKFDQRVSIIAQLAQRSDIEGKYDLGKKIFEKRKAFYHACVSKRTMAHAELQEICERKEIVGQVESPACPLCEQLLTLKRKQFLLHQLTRQEKLASHKFERSVSVLKLLEEALKAQRSGLEVEAKVCSSLQSLEQDLMRCNNDIELLEAELKSLNTSLQDVHFKINEQEKMRAALDLEILDCDAKFEDQLCNNPAIVSKKNELYEVALRISSVEYDPKNHQSEQKRLLKLDAVLYDIRQQANLFEEGVRLRHQARSIAAEIKRARNGFEVKSSMRRDRLSELTLVDGSDVKLRDLESSRQLLLASRDRCSQALGSLVERKKRCLQAQGLRDEALAEIELLIQEKKEYEMLVDAYGKNGIQALLIEEVLPEVEHEANVLLARLTDNQMQIFIESLRDLKSGGVRETLDIQISDGVGIRPYEMFSGGEAFRIDFALRIAVSKLLARRAGTHLQTLFIDEGFGSQDEEGLSRLTKALFAVQRDFEKIIVVSHLERLKESFPVHILVEKKSNGSTVSIEERG